MMAGSEIPSSDFIARDLRDTQYIAKESKIYMLEELVKDVVSTSRYWLPID
jgi:hypothetical protein